MDSAVLSLMHWWRLERRLGMLALYMFPEADLGDLYAIARGRYEQCVIALRNPAPVITFEARDAP